MGCFAGAALLWRSQACLIISIASYSSIFLSFAHRLFLPKSELVVRVGQQKDAQQQQQRASPSAAPSKAIEWCEFEREGSLCSTESGSCTGGGSRTCEWFPKAAPVAVIFSDRLVKSGMVTMASLCRHPTTLYVLVLMQVTSTYKPSAPRPVQRRAHECIDANSPEPCSASACAFVCTLARNSPDVLPLLQDDLYDYGQCSRVPTRNRLEAG